MMINVELSVERKLAEETEAPGKKDLPELSLCPPQIPHDLT
jgi:hypothetical protein